MSQVFVSHSNADQAVAERVVEALSEAGLTSSHPASFTPGTDFVQELEHAMRGTDCVVVLWSKAAAASARAQEEIRLAIEAWSNDRLVLVSLDDTTLPVGLRDLKAIPFGRDLDERALRDLIERVRGIVGPHERPPSAVEAPAAMRGSRVRKAGHRSKGWANSRWAPARWVLPFFLHLLGASADRVRRAAGAGQRALAGARRRDSHCRAVQSVARPWRRPICWDRHRHRPRLGRLEMGSATVTPASKRGRCASVARRWRVSGGTACLRLL